VRPAISQGLIFKNYWYLTGPAIEFKKNATAYLLKVNFSVVNLH